MMFINCEVCGKETRVHHLQRNKRFCSRQCFGKWRKVHGKKGKDNPNWKRIKRICMNCKKEFYIKPSRIKRTDRNQGRFCSKNCVSKWYMKGETHPRWKGGKITKICLTCGKSFLFQPCPSKSGQGKFCSIRCNAVYHVRKPPFFNTSIERKIKSFLIKSDIPFQQQALVGGIMRADFLLPNKIIIECDGDYWHSLLKTKQRDFNNNFVLGFKGYTLLRFSETDINKHFRKCCNKIIKVVGSGEAGGDRD